MRLARIRALQVPHAGAGLASPGTCPEARGAVTPGVKRMGVSVCGAFGSVGGHLRLNRNFGEFA